MRLFHVAVSLTLCESVSFFDPRSLSLIFGLWIYCQNMLSLFGTLWGSASFVEHWKSGEDLRWLIFRCFRFPDIWCGVCWRLLWANSKLICALRVYWVYVLLIGDCVGVGTRYDDLECSGINLISRNLSGWGAESDFVTHGSDILKSRWKLFRNREWIGINTPCPPSH